MCGIAGMIDLGKDHRPPPVERVSAMARAIVHRGPDEDGFLNERGLALASHAAALCRPRV